jgi:replication initiation protein RepC
MGRLRRRATIARKGIIQILETARDYDLSGEDWATLESDAQAIVQALKGVERPDEMEAGVAGLEQRQREARARLEMLLEDVKKAPSEVQNEPHQNTYNRPPNPKKDTVIAAKTCNEPAETPVHLSAAAESQNRPEKGMVHGIRPDELVRLAPRLKSYLRRLNATWPEIIDAADWLRHDLDVSKPLWGDACLTMGRDLAAVALAIVSTKDPEHFRTTPGGYFHGMVQKAKAGELHLERTVWALRRAAQPGQAPRKG